MNSPAGPENRKSILLLGAFSLLLYVATTGYGFVVDDELLLLRNPYVRSFRYLPRIFGRPFWQFRGSYDSSSFYRPLVMLSLLAERSVFGLRPGFFHFVNALLNLLVVILVYCLARRLWPEGRAALWSGLLFAALPVHTENVAPVFGIPDLECAALMLGATLLYVHPVHPARRSGSRSSWGAAGLLLGAALAKEVALALPLLFVFYEHFVRGGQGSGIREGLRRHAPALMSSAGYLTIRVWALRSAAATVAHGAGAGVLAVSALSLLGKYFTQLIWPWRLVFLNSFRPSPSGWNPWVGIGVAGLALAVAGLIHFWNRDRRVCFALLWFFLTLAPVLNMNWLGSQPFADRYLYIPSMGICWLAGRAFDAFGNLERYRPASRKFLTALPLVLVFLATLRTLKHLPDWQNDLTLAAAILRDDPQVAKARVILGRAYQRQGQHVLARREYAAAISQDPSLPEAYLNLATDLMATDEMDGARGVLERLIRINSSIPEAYSELGLAQLALNQGAAAERSFARAVALNPDHAEALNNLALLRDKDGQTAEARVLLERAIHADPESADAHNSLGSIYARQGDLIRAEEEFRRALQLAPGSELPCLNLAALYERRHDIAAALASYRQAVRIHPNSAAAQFRLGVLEMKTGNLPEAIRALEQGVMLEPNSALVHAQLGQAYRASGKPAEARRELETALRLSPGDEETQRTLRGLR